MMRVSNNGDTTLRYGNPDGVAGLVVNVDKAVVLGFDIRAAQNHPLYDALGTDMFASAMQRLGNEGIQVNQIRGAWEAALTLLNICRSCFEYLDRPNIPKIWIREGRKN